MINLAHIIAREFIGTTDLVIDRFPTGLCHHVYSVKSANSDPIVIRMSPPSVAQYFAGSIFWYDRLRAVGVPLARLLKVGSIEGMSYAILEHLPGQDLGLVYESLAQSERRSIAHEVATIENSVAKLPIASGYGYAFSYEDQRLLNSWEDFLRNTLKKAQQWIDSVGRVSSKHVHQVETKFSAMHSYFQQIEPQAFLDDLTTKNILIKDGKVTGVVDCDQVCFGDRLYVIGLTQTSLLSIGANTDYIDAWTEAWYLSPIEKKVIALYSAIFCTMFIGELGQTFNGQGKPFDHHKYQQYIKLLDALLRQV